MSTITSHMENGPGGGEPSRTRETCPACGGLCVIDANQMPFSARELECPSCGGDGEASDDGAPLDCPTCGGTGVVCECPECGGEGTVEAGR